jgi:hypothetical protein
VHSKFDEPEPRVFFTLRVIIKLGPSKDMQ